MPDRTVREWLSAKVRAGLLELFALGCTEICLDARRHVLSADVGEEADLLLREAQAKARQAKKNAALVDALLDVTTPRETRRYEQTGAGQVAAIAELSVGFSRRGAAGSSATIL